MTKGKAIQPLAGNAAVPKTCSIDLAIGARLHSKRVEHGISAEVFAASIGITKEDLLECEAGTVRVDARLMLKMCKGLDVTAKYFFEPLLGKGTHLPDGAVGIIA